MFFDINNNYFEDYLNNDIDSINFNRNNTLYSLDEGFNKGNMFEDIYSKYKNHVYKLKVSSEKDELLYKIQMYTFALKDLNLYLDVNPTDESIIRKYNEVNNLLKKSKNEYINSYGPLCSNESNDDNNWEWINNPWPWDKEGK